MLENGAVLLKGQHFKVTEDALMALVECGYYNESVMNPLSIEGDPTFICIGHDKDGDAVCVAQDVFKPEYLELSVDDIHEKAFTNEYCFWVTEYEVRIKL